MLAPLPPSIIPPETTGDGPDAVRRRLGGLAGPSPVVFCLFKASMTAYYNEIDPYACDWLENLIFCGLIADGVVDRRSIVDVRPSDLAGFTQCHFFAGIGIWSHALRRAGWRDDRPVWTGSCPCQPFSAAGKGGGFDDERHLWPAWHHLVDQCGPPVVLGEQVASKDALAWWDLVHSDLEVSDYAAGAADLCAAGVGAPHIRQRLFWVANGDAGGRARVGRSGQERTAERGQIGSLADDDDGAGLGEQRSLRVQGPTVHDLDRCGADGGVGDSDKCTRKQGGAFVRRGNRRSDEVSGAGSCGSSGVGFWSAADWLPCRDGKWRPVEPGTFPLAHGTPDRVGRLRAYGNAIVAPLAQAWIETVMECMP